MQATISNKRFDNRGLALAAFSIGLLAALIVAVAVANRAGENTAIRAASVSAPAPQADARFIEENLYLPSGRLAEQAASFESFQFAEQNLALPTGAVAAAVQPYGDMVELELNLNLPAMAVDTATLARIDENSWGTTFVLPAVTASTANAAALALIDENSWGETFAFSALPEPGTLPQAHEGALSY